MKKQNVLISILFISMSFYMISCNSNQETSSKKTSNQEQVVEKKIEEPLKIGDKYQGGYIFYLDFDGKHGKICSPKAKGDDKLISKSEAINDVDNLELNGYSDWRLPNREELELVRTLLDPKDMFFNTNEYYITSEVHEIIYTETTTERHNYVMYMSKNKGGFDTDMADSDEYLYRAIREF